MISGMKPEPYPVLLVEDDPSWQQLLVEILNDQGYAVQVAEDVQQAEQHLHAQSHRLLVADLSLAAGDHTNTDGLKVIAAAHRLDPGCRAILLSGFATVELAVSAIQEYGALTCLRKENFKRIDFLKWVHQALAVAPQPEREPSSTGQPAEDPAPGSPLKEGSAAPGPEWRAAALVVEDDAGWRSLLSELLEEAGYRVQVSSSYVEALGLLVHERFSLLVTDLSLASSLEPDSNLDGYRLIHSSHQTGIPTIVVSGFAEPELIEQAYTQQEIFACLEKQSFDRSAFLTTVARAQKLAPQPELERLSEREREVLGLLAQGLTNKQISSQLFISTNTVKRHLKSIFEKLEVNTRAAATAKAAAGGLGRQNGG